MSIKQKSIKRQPNIQRRSSPQRGSSLGITTKSASNTSQLESKRFAVSLDNTKKRYRLQRIAKAQNPNSRICACMSSIKSDKSTVEVHYDDTKRHAHYRNLMRCDSVWECPVCSARITSQRAKEIQEAYASAVENFGWSVVMVTYTISHDKRRSLETNINDLREARRKMRSGRKWQDFKESYGYKGCISSMEVTYGVKNGWHVHVHELMFLNLHQKKQDKDMFKPREIEKMLQEKLAEWWVKSVKKVGRKATRDHGLKVDATDNEITWYIAKFGKLPAQRTWDVGLELTKSMHKMYGGGLHPFEILEFSADHCVPIEERKLYQALWAEYRTAFKGKRQTFWTNGLKDLLQVEHIEDDADVDEQPQKQAFAIEAPVWRAICYMDRRADLLNIVCETRFNERIIKRWLRKTMYDANARKSRFDKPMQGTVWDHKANKLAIDGVSSSEY